MRGLKIALLGALSATLMTSAAFSADLLAPVTEAADAVDTSAWDGLYIGLSGDAWNWQGPIPETAAGIGVVAGVNFTMDQFLIGAEGFLEAYQGNVISNGWLAGGEVRAGFLAADSALIYGGLGGIAFSGGANYVTAGVGVEFMASDNMSVDIEGKYWDQTNGPYAGANISGQLNWHF